MTERGGAIIILKDFSAPNAPPPTIPKYFTILMTEMRDAINFVGFWRSRPPPPMPPPMPPPLTPQYLTILMTVRGGGAISFVGFWRPPPRRHNT